VQHVADPVQPSVDPAYANARNEIWLDLRTDADGVARSAARVDWAIPPGGAGSVVVHEHGTHTGAGEAGTAGDRLACVDVPFNGPARP
jgi:Cu-Zn family superoxide dismutase